MTLIDARDRFDKIREKRAILKIAFKRPIEDRKPEPWHNIVPDPDNAA